MATTTSITTTYAGESAGKYISYIDPPLLYKDGQELPSTLLYIPGACYLFYIFCYPTKSSLMRS